MSSGGAKHRHPYGAAEPAFDVTRVTFKTEETKIYFNLSHQMGGTGWLAVYEFPMFRLSMGARHTGSSTSRMMAESTQRTLFTPIVSTI